MCNETKAETLENILIFGNEMLVQYVYVCEERSRLLQCTDTLSVSLNQCVS